MAVIWKTKRWLWWLVGVFCALIFGRGAGAGEDPAPKPVYGMRPMPPRLEQPAVTEEQKQQAGKLIDEYLAAELSPAEPPAEVQAQIDQLIKDLSAKEFATREAASAELIKLGQQALPALRKAAESKDPEVAWRSKAAIEKIGDGAGVEGLRAMGWPAQMAVTERTEKERKVVVSASAAAGEAEGAGKKDEAGKLRAEAKVAQARVDALGRLATKIQPRMIMTPHFSEMVAPPPMKQDK